ncbi:chaperone protein dnaJ 11, chloroplastic-like [Olea europaea var. sylvestris]|uniref:chaperone protein dnaJ 11, chloroplastic-like n=1 Tax=Olea europaea var. sylvestris TaxID=158386 RepID=UPI000C1D8C81|nr:chaperone protein dnaJ 11, chloroplastic-like [Olea europaea var. sylvestris]
MASTSFSLSNQTIHSTIQPPCNATFRRPLRISATCATSERTSSTKISTGYAPKQGSLYEVLGIQTGASCQEIKTAYRKLARSLHPDVASNSGDEFMRVHTAYATLSDPEKRANYDTELFHRRRPTALSARGYSCRSRNWETDQCW